MHCSWKLIVGSLLSFFILSTSLAQLPANYQDLTAIEKQDLLWSEITKSNAENPLPEITANSFQGVYEKLKGLFNLSPTFDYASDEVPEGRTKILHANGSVGKVAFIPTSEHSFTGIYKTGGIGLARLSLAMPASDNSYIPGMAVKFLINNQPSLNLHVMNALEGQEWNWNYFAKDFSNQVAHPTGWILSAIEKIFEWTHDPANRLPLVHLAAWTSEGKPAGIPVYPERIYFKPAAAVKDIIPESSREDFRLSLAKVSFGPLYEVYGLYQGNEFHIGTLMLESQILASLYGDKVLFFQHQK
jgi:hypothetical protein